MKYFILFLVPVLFPSFNNQFFDCGDLLHTYAKKPTELQFVECKKGEGQTIVEAIYQVPGNQSKIVEAYLVKTYGMGELKFTCCGWEPTEGKMGNFTCEKLKEVNANYTMNITMFGNAEIKNDKGEVNLEEDRKKIPFFNVFVSIVDV